MSPVLSIVLGTYNRFAQLKNCIESIEAQTSTPHIVYVSDAGSTDGSVEYLTSIASSWLIPVLTGEKMGQARAYNEVFDRVDTPFVCWLSDDNEVVNHGLDVAVRALQKHPRFGMIGLKVRDLQGPFTDAPYGGGISSIGILNVNQGVLPTHVLQSVGGFSEAFRDYGIDPDLTGKVLFSGWDIALTKTVAIHHFRNWSTQKGTPEYVKMKRVQKRAVWMYSAKYGPYAAVGLRHSFKKRLFALLQKIWPKRLYINEQRRFLTALPRDLFNLFNGRFISLWDPLFTAGCEHYLVQHCPRALLPAELPDDPPSFADDAPAAAASTDPASVAELRRSAARDARRVEELKDLVQVQVEKVNLAKQVKQEIETKARERSARDAERIAELKSTLAQFAEKLTRVRRVKDEEKAVADARALRDGERIAELKLRLAALSDQPAPERSDQLADSAAN